MKADQVIPFIPWWRFVGEDVVPHQMAHHEVLGTCRDYWQSQPISTCLTHQPSAPERMIRQIVSRGQGIRGWEC
jgi:hypothetical protein